MLTTFPSNFYEFSRNIHFYSKSAWSEAWYGMRRMLGIYTSDLHPLRETDQLYWNLYKRCKESNKLSLKDPEEGILLCFYFIIKKRRLFCTENNMYNKQTLFTEGLL